MVGIKGRKRREKNKGEKGKRRRKEKKILIFGVFGYNREEKVKERSWLKIIVIKDYFTTLSLTNVNYKLTTNYKDIKLIWQKIQNCPRL